MAKQIVGPLNWAFPIVDSEGRPTPDFQQRWSEQTRVNEEIPDLSTAAAVSALLDEIGSTEGSVLVRGSEQWEAREGISEDEINLSDVETNDVSTERHGFAPTLPGDGAQYLDGTGEWSTPAGGGGGGGGAWQLFGLWDHSLDGDTAQVDFTGLAGVDDVFIIVDAVTATAGFRSIRLSTDNGVSFFGSSGDYISVASSGSPVARSEIHMTSISTSTARSSQLGVFGLSASGIPKPTWGGHFVNRFVGSTDPVDAVRVFSTGGGSILTGGKITCLAR